jgi:hypothetical protein
MWVPFRTSEWKPRWGAVEGGGRERGEYRIISKMEMVRTMWRGIKHDKEVA